MGHINRSDTARHSNLLKEIEMNSFDFMRKEDSFGFISEDSFHHLIMFVMIRESQQW